MPNEKRRPNGQDNGLNRIKCECGKEILLVPDVEAMSRAIGAHVSEHLKREKNQKIAAFESNRLWNLLVAAAFTQTYVS